MNDTALTYLAITTLVAGGMLLTVSLALLVEKVRDSAPLGFTAIASFGLSIVLFNLSGVLYGAAL